MAKLSLVALVVLLSLAGCAAPEPATPPPEELEIVPEPTVLGPGRRVWRTADGIEIPFEVHGQGQTNVVLVHCWMCDRTFWAAQIPALAAAGYRVIALDLPGHGEAGAARSTWTVAGLGADVAGLLAYVDLHDVILVGHSMGGPVALKAAALAKDRVRGIVAVDTLHDAEFDFDRPEVAQFLAMFDSDFPATCGAMVQQMFVEADAAAMAAEVRRRSCENGNAAVGQALMHDFASIDLPAWFREAAVPIRAINAAAPNETRVEVNRKYADFDAVLVPDVGHYLQMTRPAEFNEHLLRVLGELAGSGPG